MAVFPPDSGFHALGCSGGGGGMKASVVIAIAVFLGPRLGLADKQ